MEPLTSVSLTDAEWAKVIASLALHGEPELGLMVRAQIIEKWESE